MSASSSARSRTGPGGCRSACRARRSRSCSACRAGGSRCRSCRRGPRGRVGQRDLRAGSLVAAPRLSRRSTPRNATRLPQSSDARWMTGSSTRHGPHHDAQTLTTTGCPRSARTPRLQAPCARPAGARWPARAARPAPAGRRRAWRAAPAREIVLTFGWLGVLDSGAWLQPDADDAARATAPRIHGSSGACGEGCQTRRTRPAHQAQSAVSCVCTHGEGHRIQGSPSRASSPDQPGGSESPGTAARRDSPFSTDSQVMADSMSAAAEAAPIPDQAAIERAEAFTRERFVHAGEDRRRRARPWLRRAAARSTPRCAEIDAGAKVPSTQWRRALLAAARPRARAQRGRAAPRRRHDAEPPPGRRALGHADRAARRASRTAHGVAAPTAGAGARGRRGARARSRRRRRRARRAERARRSTRTTTRTTRTTTSERRATRTTTTRTTSRGRGRRRATTSPRTSGRTTPSPTSTRTSTRAPPTTPTPTSASGSSTRPAPARRSPRWASSRPRAPAAS